MGWCRNIEAVDCTSFMQDLGQSVQVASIDWQFCLSHKGGTILTGEETVLTLSIFFFFSPG